MTLAKHWLRPSNTTQYLYHTNLVASSDCYVTLLLNRTGPVESVYHHRVKHFLHALQALSVYHDHRATIAPIAHVTWTYRVYRLSSHNGACYIGLLCCRNLDGHTHRYQIR
jgi:hypothetical protein